MRYVNFEFVEDGDKYYELIPLYNDWHNNTRFMSTGNMNVPEWDKLMDYCMDNKMETAHFFLDLIDCHKQLYDEHTFGSPFVGFFCGIIEKCFEEDEMFPKFSGFVGGEIVQKCYKSYVEWYLDGKPRNMNWMDKLSNILKIDKNEKSE